MTIKSIKSLLSGPAHDRSHAAAVSGLPMTDTEARYVLRERIKATGDHQSAIPMARLALKFGNLDKSARELYSEYLNRVGFCRITSKREEQSYD